MFDYKKWAEDGADFAKLPADEKAKIRTSIESEQRPDAQRLMDEARQRFVGAGEPEGKDIDAKIRTQLSAYDRQRRFDDQVRKLKSELGNDFDRYAPKAREYMERGYDPEDAFRLVRMPDVVSEAERKARADLAAAAGQRAAETGNERGTGNGAGTSANGGVTNNPWLAKKDDYDRKRTELRRMDMRASEKFLRENPQFIEAMKQHGDMKAISKR